MKDAQQKLHNIPSQLLQKKIRHANRTACNLAHYLQKDFAAVKAEILIDDVQRAGFVHDIRVESNGRELTLNAIVADTLDGAQHEWVPVLRMAFKDEALRQFVYAGWRRFLDDHARQKRWTKGKKAEAVYPLLVNALEPLVYFEPGAGDNLRAVRALMKAVGDEARGRGPGGRRSRNRAA